MNEDETKQQERTDILYVRFVEALVNHEAKLVEAAYAALRILRDIYDVGGPEKQECLKFFHKYIDGFACEKCNGCSDE